MSLPNLTASEMTFWQERNHQVKKVKTFIITECSERAWVADLPTGTACDTGATAGDVSD